ncbi:MAG TPA: sensor histidine kinase, partial [Patescibacteria group bacterium]|nr:sensor histidine kinase [Patescibacteria group bacterium]
VRVRTGNKAAVLTVDDTGQGIRPDDLPHVFERFWRADDAPSGGTGLGLAIAAWIVERHGGRIAAANRPEGGARFEARIPLRG